jgi:hypothetical protein
MSDAASLGSGVDWSMVALKVYGFRMGSYECLLTETWLNHVEMRRGQIFVFGDSGRDKRMYGHELETLDRLPNFCAVFYAT